MKLHLTAGCTARGFLADRVTRHNGNVPRQPAHLDRMVTDGSNHIEWLRARARGITATDVAKLTSAAAIERTALDKLHGSGFAGNVFTDHGKAREPVIAAWVLENFQIEPSQALFHAPTEKRHLATPDGIGRDRDGSLVLAEIKTTGKPWRSIPTNYLRQVYWQQYVLGAQRTLVVWEEHRNFVPLHAEPEYEWVERDDNEIGRLVGLANELITELHRITRPAHAALSA